MQARRATDPTSWTFQAAIHGTFTRPAHPTWNTCQHASWYFLPWHRMQVYFFERIVRAAVQSFGGPADFALPYWNYDQVFPRNTLPPAFRADLMPDGSANPLRVLAPLRADGIARGGALRTRDTSSARAMGFANFVGARGSGSVVAGPTRPTSTEASERWNSTRTTSSTSFSEALPPRRHALATRR